MGAKNDRTNDPKPLRAQSVDAGVVAAAASVRRTPIPRRGVTRSPRRTFVRTCPLSGRRGHIPRLHAVPNSTSGSARRVGLSRRLVSRRCTVSGRRLARPRDVPAFPGRHCVAADVVFARVLLTAPAGLTGGSPDNRGYYMARFCGSGRARRGVVTRRETATTVGPRAEPRPRRSRRDDSPDARRSRRA